MRFLAQKEYISGWGAELVNFEITDQFNISINIVRLLGWSKVVKKGPL